MNPDLWKALQNLVMIAVTAFTTAMMGWLLAHGYIKQDIDAAAQTITTQQDAAKVEITAKTDAAVEQITAQTDEQTETVVAAQKEQGVKTRQKVVEETNEVIAKAETTAAVQAAPAMRSAQPQTDPAIAELLLELTARMDKIESKGGTP